MGQSSVCTGGDVEQMKPAREQKRIKRLGALGAWPGRQGVLAEKVNAGLLISLEQAPGKQAAHVQLLHPGRFQDRQGELALQFGTGHGLSPLHEIIFMLKCRDALQHRHDSIEALLHRQVVGLKSSVGSSVCKGMGDGRRTDAGG